MFRILRNILLLSVFPAILVLSAGCGGSSSGSSDPVWPAMDQLKALDEESISEIIYTRGTEAGLNSGSTTDKTVIEDIYLRLVNVSAAGKSDQGADDNDLTVKVNADGSSLSFSFEDDILVLEDGTRYETENLDKLRSYIDGLIAEEEEPAGNSEPADTSGTSGTANTSYDIMEGFQKNASPDGSIEYLYFNDFLITMPGNDKWSFETTKDSVTFYLFSAKQEGYGGMLVTIAAYDMDDDSYMEIPSYHIAGTGRNCGKRFIAIYPTDVQWNGNDKTQDSDYRELKEYLDKIGENAVNSPLQTADGD